MTITLPDTLASWPFPRRINPHYETVAPESSAWVRRLRAFGPLSQRAFDKCDFGQFAPPERICQSAHRFLFFRIGLLAALAYPDLSAGACGLLAYNFL